MNPNLCDERGAYRIGLTRAEASLAESRSDRYGFRPSVQIRRHVDGMAALAEWTVAKTLQREWLSTSRRPDKTAEDVDGGISVRWTRHSHGRLIVYRGDRGAAIWVLVTGDRPPLTMVGWIPDEYARQDQFWNDDAREPAYFVPQNVLCTDFSWVDEVAPKTR